MSNSPRNDHSESMSNQKSTMLHPSENTHLTQEHTAIPKLNSKQNESKQKSNEQLDSTKKNYRVIHLSKPKKNKLKYHYPNNTITTSKYTWYNFLPLTLILQFKRYANIYFLVTMIIQCIPIISPLNPITAILPFIIVLAVSIFREGLEDCRRHSEDAKENAAPTYKYNYMNQKYEATESRYLEVGDVILIKNNSIIPADCLLLYCANISKIAYVMTSNLDGEKNLKPRYCHPQIYRALNQSHLYFSMSGKLKYNHPDADLTKFNGSLFLTSHTPSIKLDVKHVIYKGTMLANTKFAIAMVVYTGKETKIVMNSQKCPPKTSHLERTVNKLIIVIFIIQISFCIILSGLNSWWYGKYDEDNSWYLNLSDWLTNRHFSGFISFWTFLLLLNTMIPISLIVTIEVVKYSQAFLMNWDVEMYSFIKERFSQCNSCSLNEELGQIKYIFSDKTGTLTANKLEFTACAIGNELFGMSEEELLNTDGKTLAKRKEILKPKNDPDNANTNKAIPIVYTFPDIELKQYSTGNKQGDSFSIQLSSLSGKTTLPISNTKDIVDLFLSCLCLNHSCFVEKTPKPGVNVQEPKLQRITTKTSLERAGTNQLKEKLESVMSLNLVENYDKYLISYLGENPDEIILVDTAKRLGYVYLGGDETMTNIRINSELNGNVVSGRNQKWTILKTIKFTSARGKMSVICRLDNGNIMLFCKGGNTKIIPALTEEQPFYEKINERSLKFSEMGLRVLWIAVKVLDEDEYFDWKGKFDEIPSEDENSQNRLISEIEKGMTLIGCTAVEDNLQDKVPDTIKDLQTAGVNIWVLTGDNLPTAKNITISCKLLPPNMELYEIYEDIDKYKKFVNSMGNNDDNVFTNEKIQKANQSIQDFEKKYPEVYKEINQIQGIGYKKAVLLVGLEQMLIYYNKRETTNKHTLRGILIESAMLNLVLPHQDHKESKYYLHPLTHRFLDLTLNSQAVVCCRVSPMQKALVVRMIKSNIENAITLAIGDGANDVSMIQEADVGVGIFGEEGTQAALSSDYAIGEFKHLRKLILFHGRLNYMRIAEMITYFFFKNFLFTLPQFFFAFYSGFSGQTIFDDWFVSFFNLIFTCLPLLFKALFDQDINDNDGTFVSEHIPYTYYTGRENIMFNCTEFAKNLIHAAVFSVLVFFCTEYMLHYTISLNEDGEIADFWIVANTMYTCIIFIVDYKLLVNTKYHTWVNWVIMGVTSYGLYVLYFCVSSFFSFSMSRNVAFVIFKYPHFYLVVFVLMHVEFVFDVAVNHFTLNYMETPVSLLRKYVYVSLYFNYFI
jgi:phospholipid-translocating P-type ATPase (flippase)